MKAVVQDMKSGRLSVGEVPPPALRPDGVLVRVRRSLISLGTDRAVIALAKKTPLGKAQDRPDLARKVINKALQEGWWSTYQVVRNLLAAPIPLGYSCAGEVVAVGARAGEFKVGDWVACAGLNFANHAEVDYVPRNLAVRMPPGLSPLSASFVALGAIAMQGVRLAQVKLGERVVVLGLGLVGQICAQLVRCGGATVIAMDPDVGKHELARRLGAHHVLATHDALLQAVGELSDGVGADSILVCAASKSSGILRDAAEAVRLKGRVVVVGDVGMDLERRPYFEKEIELVVSRSYGPGRYDPTYEERGVDYPAAYVRWTERRNMLSFLELVARGDVAVEPLVTHSFPIEQAETAYEIVTGKREEPAIAIALTYDGPLELPTRVALRSAAAPSALGERVRLGVIGAGQFAQGVLLPALARQRVAFQSFCTASGFTSRSVAERYRAAACTSDPREVIHDPAVDAVVIATRHDQHAPLVLEALRAGKAVFTEKPLCIEPAELSELCAFAREHGPPRLVVGFNRRFAPLARDARAFFAEREEPLSIAYRVNAGAFPPETWVFDPEVGGGRLVGEGCHFVDFICFLAGALPERVHAERIATPGESAPNRDSVVLTLRLADGSIGTLHYLANGDPSLAKEYVEIFGARRSALLDNFRSLTTHRANRRRKRRLLNQQKGFDQEAAEFVEALRTGGPMPVPFEQLVAVTQTTFLALESLSCGAPVPYRDPD
jgi:predicted dehydrogenase/threonine dehydrogenase-like Zn-dependent dehydrogenase